MKKAHKYSDKYLSKLWRRAVLLTWECKCAYCGSDNVDALQCHHIVRRRHKILRHSWRNGVPGCHECHRFYHTKLGEQWLAVTVPDYGWLCEMEQVHFKQYAVDNCMTDSEFSQFRHDELIKQIEVMNERF